MSYAKLVCQSNRNLKRVHTRSDKKRFGLPDPTSGVEIVNRSSRSGKDGSVTLTLTFEDGRKVSVTYKDIE